MRSFSKAKNWKLKDPNRISIRFGSESAWHAAAFKRSFILQFLDQVQDLLFPIGGFFFQNADLVAVFMLLDVDDIARCQRGRDLLFRNQQLLFFVSFFQKHVEAIIQSIQGIALHHESHAQESLSRSCFEA